MVAGRWILAGLAALAWGGLLASPRPTALDQPARGKRAAILAKGLAVWRKPDKNGASCASCHSPDGIELAAYAFDDGTIHRRAYPHVGLLGGGVLVDYVHELRSVLGISNPADPMEARPMQPGGKILPGSTPAARDLAFGRTLAKLLPAFMHGPIDSLEAAKRARDEILKLDARRVPIGIPLNRISEDRYHGAEHASLANWIADVPVSAPRQRLYELQDAYLKSPSGETLRVLDEFLVKNSAAARNPCDQMVLGKYRAMLYLQHDLRMHALGKPTLADRGPVALAGSGTAMLPNPMWDMGEIGRLYMDIPPDVFGLPADVASKKTGGPTFAEQMKQMRLSWYWSGWMLDQGLQRSGFQKETRRADYFSKLLLEDGPYPIHCAFMLTKKLATESFVTEAWLPGPLKQHVVVNYSFLVGRSNLATYEPRQLEQKKLFQTFLANSFRMNLFLLEDELARTKTVDYQKEPVLQQIALMAEYLEQAPGARAQADAELARQTEAALRAAKLVLPY